MFTYLTELDAGPFVKSEGTYFEEFKKVLSLLMYCYDQIIQKETPKSYEKGFPLENHLRNILVNKYLRIFKEKFGIDYLGFEVEVGKIDLNYVDVWFIDIKVTNAGLMESLKCVEDSYYAIECKRLDGYAKKTNAYVEEGVLRFVEGKYSEKMPFACMVGFIESGNPKSIISKIKKKLEKTNEITTLENLNSYNLGDGFDFCYSSKHERNSIAPIDLYHLMFDYTSLILI